MRGEAWARLKEALSHKWPGCKTAPYQRTRLCSASTGDSFSQRHSMPKPKGAKGNQTWRSQARETALPAQKAELDPLDMEDQADALTMAAMQGNTEAVQALMDRGVSPNAKDTIGVAPLHWGAFCGHAGVVGVLIEAGAEVHCRDQEGRTPLHVAAYESHVDVLKRLLQAGADIAAPDNSESPTADARAQRATGSERTAALGTAPAGAAPAGTAPALPPSLVTAALPASWPPECHGANYQPPALSQRAYCSTADRATLLQRMTCCVGDLRSLLAQWGGLRCTAPCPMGRRRRASFSPRRVRMRWSRTAKARRPWPSPGTSVTRRVQPALSF